MCLCLKNDLSLAHFSGSHTFGQDLMDRLSRGLGISILCLLCSVPSSGSFESCTAGWMSPAQVSASEQHLWVGLHPEFHLWSSGKPTGLSPWVVISDGRGLLGRESLRQQSGATCLRPRRGTLPTSRGFIKWIKMSSTSYLFEIWYLILNRLFMRSCLLVFFLT